jgi:hypothetical protein
MTRPACGAGRFERRQIVLTTDALKNFGVDIETGLARCMGNEALYLRLASSVVNEKGFEKLQSAIAEKDYDAAFEAAHALKGVLGNLSITPLYDKTCEINELLRARTDMDYSELLNELMTLRDEYLKLCS